MQAQDSGGTRRAVHFEVVPYLAYRDGGEFDIENSNDDARVDGHGAFALAFNMVTADDMRYHVFYSRQHTHVESSPLQIEYLQLGGIVAPEPGTTSMGYVIGSIGVTRFAPGSAGTSDATRFSLGVGGGLRIPTRSRVEVLLEARGYLTFVSASSSVFCGSGAAGGACALTGSGSSFLQYELLAGLAFAF